MDCTPKTCCDAIGGWFKRHWRLLVVIFGWPTAIMIPFLVFWLNFINDGCQSYNWMKLDLSQVIGIYGLILFVYIAMIQTRDSKLGMKEVSKIPTPSLHSGLWVNIVFIAMDSLFLIGGFTFAAVLFDDSKLCAVSNPSMYNMAIALYTIIVFTLGCVITLNRLYTYHVVYHFLHIAGVYAFDVATCYQHRWTAEELDAQSKEQERLIVKVPYANGKQPPVK